MRDFTSFELSCVKIHPRGSDSDLYANLRKKGIGLNKKIFFGYISPICPEVLSGWICTKFGIGRPLADVINCADCFVDRFRGIDFVGG